MPRSRPGPHIIGHVVIRNEADRYLRASMEALRTVVDDLVAYDDQSDDGSYELLTELGVTVGRRPDNTPSFTQHEGLFRQAGWDFMEQAAQPQPGDWILSMDADEFLVGTDPELDVPGFLHRLVDTASQSVTAWNIPVAEVFDLRAGANGDVVPYVRVDGLWGTIVGCRLVRWRPDGRFSSKVEACGSVPQTWLDWRNTTDRVQILHLGYAREQDRRVRSQRYRSGRGHNLRHINSILAKPTLQPWNGRMPRLNLIDQ